MKFALHRCFPAFALGALVVVGCSDGDNGSDGTSGANGAVSLIKATTLPVGDTQCPAGGVAIATGLDDGDGGGVAGDGVLQDGEIDSTEYVCSTNSNPAVETLSAPAGAAGTFAINARGGNGTAMAGHAGYVEVYHNYGTNGGHIKVTKTGSIDASFVAPTLPVSSQLGATPWVVATGTTHVKRVASITDASDMDGGALTAGDIVEEFSSCYAYATLYRWNSTSSAERLTGAHVQAGATVVFDHSAASACRNHSVAFDGVFRHEGTLTAGTDANGVSDAIFFVVTSYIGATGSAVSLVGTNTGTNGGDGGSFYVVANNGAEAGSVWNFGSITTSGASGADGGAAGEILLYASADVINTGALTAKGGEATELTGAAGDGGDTTFEAVGGSLSNAGAIDCSGGSGGAYGGVGCGVSFLTDAGGDVRNSGQILTAGGASSTSCAAPCYGGRGGDVQLVAYGDLYNSGNLVSFGGDSVTGQAAAGGNIELITRASDTVVTGEPNLRRGSLWVSGNIDSHGGTGGAGNGGSGGNLSIVSDLYRAPYGQSIYVFGYGGGIDTRGGDGGAQGGYGESLVVTQNYGYDNYGAHVPGGGIVMTVDSNGKGGDATAGPGGDGGYFWLTTSQVKLGTSSSFERVINEGNAVTSGGNGTTQAGTANIAVLRGLDGVENHGNITAVAGTASGDGASGGECLSYEGYSEGYFGIALGSDSGPVVNTGTLMNNGGAATGANGYGGPSAGILLFGSTTENSGALSANGGDADASTGQGGDGATLSIRSTEGNSVSSASSMTNVGGTGSTPGASGIIVLDGQVIE